MNCKLAICDDLDADRQHLLQMARRWAADAGYTLRADAAVFAAQTRQRFDAAVVDPPRRELDETFTRALLRLAPPRLVSVSCNPATLARDLKRLSPAYALEAARPVDMFPWTANVETVVLLSRTVFR